MDHVSDDHLRLWEINCEVGAWGCSLDSMTMTINPPFVNYFTQKYQDLATNIVYSRGLGLWEDLRYPRTGEIVNVMSHSSFLP